MPTEWNIHPGLRLWVGGNNLPARQAITRFLTGVLKPPTGPLDAAVITPITPDEACYFLTKIRPRLSNDALAWIIETTSPYPAPQPDPIRTEPIPSSFRTNLDPKTPSLGYSPIATVTLEPSLLAHAYRRDP